MNINLSIQTDEEINIGLSTESEIDYDFGLNAAYTGSYEPVPTVGEQTLNTANKVMLGNLKIAPIPYADVRNTSGGHTITIA